MNDYNPLDIRGQERAKRDKDERERFAAQHEADDFKWLMSNKRGRRFVWRMLERTGIYRSSFTGNSETFFREGERNVGLRLMAMVNTHCPDKYALMLEEQKEHDARSNGERASDH